jgi:hypothetical protein
MPKEDRCQPEDKHDEEGSLDAAPEVQERRPPRFRDVIGDVEGRCPEPALRIVLRGEIEQPALDRLDAAAAAERLSYFLFGQALALPKLVNPRLHELPQQMAQLTGFRSIFRKGAIELDGPRGHEFQLLDLAVERILGRRNQQTEDEGRQRAEDGQHQLHQFHGLRVEVVAREAGLQKHPEQRRPDGAYERDSADGERKHGITRKRRGGVRKCQGTPSSRLAAPHRQQEQPNGCSRIASLIPATCSFYCGIKVFPDGPTPVTWMITSPSFAQV